jgi:hypothetical protein
MGVYISFYKALPININNKRQVNVIRQLLIQQELKAIKVPYTSIHNYEQHKAYVDNMEINRIANIPVRKKEVKWLRKASCKQVISKAYEVDLWQFANTLYTLLDNLYFPISKYISEDKYVVSFKDADSCLAFIRQCDGRTIDKENEMYIQAFFDYYGKKGLIQIY